MKTIYRTKRGYRNAMFKWVDDRDPLLGELFLRCLEITAIPRHEKLTDDLVSPGEPTEEVEAEYSEYGWLKTAPILKDKPQVNFPTLQKMYDNLIDQENIRRQSQIGLKKALVALQEYEQDNHVPLYLPWWKPWVRIDLESVDG